MEIKSKVFQIERKKPTSDFLESWFKTHNLNVVRYSIVKVEKNILTLCVSYVS